MSIELNLPPHRVDEVGCQLSTAYAKFNKELHNLNHANACRYAMWAFCLIDELRSAAPEEQRKRWAELIAEGGETQKP